MVTGVPSFAMTRHHHRHHVVKHPTAIVNRVNINTCTREELVRLPGIDESTADKIMAGRPWNDAHDLVVRGILNEDQYKQIHLKVSTNMPKHHALGTSGTH